MHSKCSLCSTWPQALGSTLALRCAGRACARRRRWNAAFPSSHHSLRGCGVCVWVSGSLGTTGQDTERDKEEPGCRAPSHPSSYWLPASPGAGPGVVTYALPDAARSAVPRATAVSHPPWIAGWSSHPDRTWSWSVSKAATAWREAAPWR